MIGAFVRSMISSTRPSGRPLLVVAHDARLDAVAVQHRAHLLRREIDVGLAVVADDEAVAVAMALDRALDFGHQLGADGAAWSWMLLL